MHIHILGICGTFMGSLAQIAVKLGHRVTGSDANVYPPMSLQLEQAGIKIIEGFEPEQLSPRPDLVIIGNALSRGNSAVERVLEEGIPYTSGPQWLRQHVLQDKWVLAVAGTHGKTTTASMLAWILEYAGMTPGFLIGGVPKNFTVSARLGETPFFVVEADEYDSAFFDKRSKFVHYLPRTLILNNLEFDHADIFADLKAIQQQMHHLVRIVPQNGLIIMPEQDQALQEVIEQGCWTPCEVFHTESENPSQVSRENKHAAEESLPAPARWQAKLVSPDGGRFSIWLDGNCQGEVSWAHSGQHNVSNALAAAAAARHVGVTPEITIAALNQFAGVKRRMECIGSHSGVYVYDDFAHHPTAIATTLAGLRARVNEEKIIAVIEPRSNSMKAGIYKDDLIHACEAADDVLWYCSADIDWDLQAVARKSPVPSKVVDTIEGLIADVMNLLEPPCHIVIMSNGGFGGLHQKLLRQLETGGFKTGGADDAI